MPRTDYLSFFGEGGSVHIRLRDLKPNTQYLLDISLSGTGTAKVYGGCGFSSSGPKIGEFPIAGAQHVFVVMPTTDVGGGCATLYTPGRFDKVEIAELGPVH
jgi:hypothetical protein